VDDALDEVIIVFLLSSYGYADLAFTFRTFDKESSSCVERWRVGVNSRGFLTFLIKQPAFRADRT